MSDKSPVFARGPRSGVAAQASTWSLPLGIAAIGALGLVTYLSLASAREAEPAALPTPPPAKAAPPPAPVVMAAAPVVAAPALLPPMPTTTERAATPPRWHAPAMVVDLSEAGAAPAAPGTATATAGDEKQSADERFAARLSGTQAGTAHATRLGNVARMVSQGTVVPAVLETAIDSDLPGSVRAVVSRDVGSFDGSTVLIPRGSKLIGEYRSGVSLGHSRAFVIWSRILTPDGVSINVGSPSTDRLGRGGLDGETDTHFFERFGGAILLSVLSAGMTAATTLNSDTAVIIGNAGQTSPVSGMDKQFDIPVTIRVPQGTPLQVFISRDLDFSTVTPAP